MKVVIREQVQYDFNKNTCSLVQEYEDGTLLITPITSEQASEWESKRKF
jgi:hypothetical protein